MLVLSRKAGENIRIGQDITLTVVEVQGNRVKLGIEAPRRYRVLRGEMIDLEPAPPRIIEVTLAPGVACTTCG